MNYHKNFQNFLTNIDRWNRKKMSKIKKKVVNDEILEICFSESPKGYCLLASLRHFE